MQSTRPASDQKSAPMHTFRTSPKFDRTAFLLFSSSLFLVSYQKEHMHTALLPRFTPSRGHSCALLITRPAMTRRPARSWRPVMSRRPASLRRTRWLARTRRVARTWSMFLRTLSLPVTISLVEDAEHDGDAEIRRRRRNTTEMMASTSPLFGSWERFAGLA